MLREALLKFTRELSSKLVIRRVSAESILVNADTYTQSIALTPDEFLGDWPHRPVGELDESHFESVFGSEPEIVLLGTGSRNIFPPRELTFCFARKGIGLEVMDTAAAARTFNVLANEGRRVVAVLYVQDQDA
jgi:uncharacterized protein